MVRRRSDEVKLRREIQAIAASLSITGGVGSGGSGGGDDNTFQEVYLASSNPELTITAVKGAVQIVDASTPTNGDLLSVADNTGVTKFLKVDADGIDVAGDIVVTGTVDGRDIAADGVATEANTAKNSYPTADETKVGFITVTDAVDLDAIDDKLAFITVTENVDLDTVATTMQDGYDNTTRSVDFLKIITLDGSSGISFDQTGTGSGDLFTIRDEDGDNYFRVSRYGTTITTGLALVGNLGITGDIIMNSATGTVDGRDIAADGVKIDANTYKISYDSTAQAEVAANTAKISYNTTAQAEVAANTLKVSNATHTGDVTGATVLNISADAVKATHLSADCVRETNIFADSVTTDKIEDDAVTNAKLATMAPLTIKGNDSTTSTGSPNNLGVDATLTLLGIGGHEARLDALEAKMEFIPKAFGRFTTANPAVLLSTSYNVSSVSRGATGQYAVVIDTDMTTANYTVLISYEDSTATIQIASTNSHTTTGFNIGLRDGTNSFSDASESVSFAIYENNT